MTRVLVCGSRSFKDYELLATTLDEYAADAHVVINGGMIGADALSSFWAYERKIDTICEGAKWGLYGSRAGPERNQHMLEVFAPDLVVAFYDKPRTESRGTVHMVSIARKANIRVIEVGP